MQLFKHTISIARPRERVFDFFVDFNAAPMWRQFVRTMELTAPGPVRAGSVIHVTMDVSGEEYAFDMTVLACERPSVWRHRTDETNYNGYVEYRFETEPGGTRVTLECVIKPRELWGWLGMPMMWLYRGKSYRGQLPSLKRAMEAGEG